MGNVYVLTNTTIGFDDTSSYVIGVYKSFETAHKELYNEIEANFKEEIEQDFIENEDGQYDDYENFEEYWKEFCLMYMTSGKLWSYTDEYNDLTTIIEITERPIID